MLMAQLPKKFSPPGSSVHRVFQTKNTGVGRQALLQGIEPTSLTSPARTGRFFITSATREAQIIEYETLNEVLLSLFVRR